VKNLKANSSCKVDVDVGHIETNFIDDLEITARTPSKSYKINRVFDGNFCLS